MVRHIDSVKAKCFFSEFNVEAMVLAECEVGIKGRIGRQARA
jgi:hypothetical protein